MKDDTLAVKLAVVALAGTVTVAGTVTMPLLLEMATLCPPLGAALLKVTEHVSVPAPDIVELLHESALRVPAAAAPEPLRLITAVGLTEELLESVRTPVKELT